MAENALRELESELKRWLVSAVEQA